MPTLPTNPYFLAVDQMLDEDPSTPFTMQGEREYQTKFLVQCRVPGLHPIAVTSAPGTPIGGSVYVTSSDYDLLAILVKKSAQRQKANDWKNWIVTCQYSTRLGGTRQSPDTQNKPEQERPDVEWDFETIKIAPQRDLGGMAMLNSAHMPFSPPPTFDVGVPVLSISRNELTFNVTKAQGYSYAVNDATFLGYPYGTVQCMPPKAKQVWRGNYRFWRVSYRLRFAPLIPNPDFDPNQSDNPLLPPNPKFIYYLWDPRLLDQGMYHLDTNAASPTFNKPVPIWKGLGPVHHPVLLDGNGQEATEVPPKPRYIDFTLYQEADFNKLIVQGLGN